MGARVLQIGSLTIRSASPLHAGGSDCKPLRLGRVIIRCPKKTKAGLGCHTFRATGITVYSLNGGLLEYAQQMVAHESAARPSSTTAATTWSCSSRVMVPAFRARRTIIRRAP